MGFIETNKARCMLSVLINTHLLLAAREHEVERYFFASSACVYAADKQTSTDVLPLKEATPILRCRRTATAGRSSSASECAAISRRTSASLRAWLATTTSTVRRAPTRGSGEGTRGDLSQGDRGEALRHHEIEIWGDGDQTRSFMFVDDCIYGTRILMAKRCHGAAEHRQRPPRHDQRARFDRRRDRRAKASSAVQPGRPGRQGSTATTPSFSNDLAGNRRSAWRRGSRRRTHGCTRRWPDAHTRDGQVVSTEAGA